MINRGAGSNTVDVASEEGDWNDWLGLVRRDAARVVVREGGDPVAVLVPLSDYRRLRRMDSARRNLRRSIDELQRSFADVPLEEIEREIASAVAEVRNEDPPERGASPS